MTTYKLLSIPFYFIFTINAALSQSANSTIKYNAFMMLIERDGDSTKNWKNSDVSINFIYISDTLNTIEINGTRDTAYYSINRQTKSYNENYNDTNMMHWTLYEASDKIYGDKPTIQFGVFDYEAQGINALLCLYMENYNVNFRLKQY